LTLGYAEVAQGRGTKSSTIAGGGDFLADEQQQSFLTRGRNLSAQLNHMHFISTAVGWQFVQLLAPWQ
jgi:hypothetical protein